MKRKDNATSLWFKFVSSPIEKLKLVASDSGLVAILWEHDSPRRVRLIEEYFDASDWQDDWSPRCNIPDAACSGNPATSERSCPTGRGLTMLARTRERGPNPIRGAFILQCC